MREVEIRVKGQDLVAIGDTGPSGVGLEIAASGCDAHSAQRLSAASVECRSEFRILLENWLLYRSRVRLAGDLADFWPIKYLEEELRARSSWTAAERLQTMRWV